MPRPSGVGASPVAAAPPALPEQHPSESVLSSGLAAYRHLLRALLMRHGPDLTPSVAEMLGRCREEWGVSEVRHGRELECALACPSIQLGARRRLRLVEPTDETDERLSKLWAEEEDTDDDSADAWAGRPAKRARTPGL
eukprot:TRINITY_DN43352_c0_g1_i1.p1 TRINITY_DN43352_c0_g1~~TRINITY_DN43352_c0_g1_i1.p1  ORF type:complete len:139 (+),score=9.25 TRINITY_DN43352_c0_g1_i1:54-470(+)